MSQAAAHSIDEAREIIDKISETLIEQDEHQTTEKLRKLFIDADAYNEEKIRIADFKSLLSTLISVTLQDSKTSTKFKPATHRRYLSHVFDQTMMNLLYEEVQSRIRLSFPDEEDVLRWPIEWFIVYNLPNVLSGRQVVPRGQIPPLRMIDGNAPGKHHISPSIVVVTDEQGHDRSVSPDPGYSITVSGTSEETHQGDVSEETPGRLSAQIAPGLMIGTDHSRIPSTVGKKNQPKIQQQRTSVLPSQESGLIDRVVLNLMDKNPIEVENQLRSEFLRMDSRNQGTLSIHKFRTFLSSFITHVLDDESGGSLTHSRRGSSAINPRMMKNLEKEVERRIINHRESNMTEMPKIVTWEFVYNLLNYLTGDPLSSGDEVPSLFATDDRRNDDSDIDSDRESGMRGGSNRNVLRPIASGTGSEDVGKRMSIDEMSTQATTRSNFSDVSEMERRSLGLQMQSNGVMMGSMAKMTEMLSDLQQVSNKLIVMMSDFEISITNEVVQLRDYVTSAGLNLALAGSRSANRTPRSNDGRDLSNVFQSASGSPTDRTKPQEPSEDNDLQALGSTTSEFDLQASIESMMASMSTVQSLISHISTILAQQSRMDTVLAGLQQAATETSRLRTENDALNAHVERLIDENEDLKAAIRQKDSIIAQAAITNHDRASDLSMLKNELLDELRRFNDDMKPVDKKITKYILDNLNQTKLEVIQAVHQTSQPAVSPTPQPPLTTVGSTRMLPQDEQVDLYESLGDILTKLNDMDFIVRANQSNNSVVLTRLDQLSNLSDSLSRVMNRLDDVSTTLSHTTPSGYPQPSAPSSDVLHATVQSLQSATQGLVEVSVLREELQFVKSERDRLRMEVDVTRGREFELASKVTQLEHELNMMTESKRVTMNNMVIEMNDMRDQILKMSLMREGKQKEHEQEQS